MATVMNVVGARPQFVKAGPVSKALAESGIEELLVNTGQHYDDLLSDAIMADVGLRNPDIDLGVGSASHGAQTAAMLERLERVIVEHSPDIVLTYGDTNSTIAAALAATKLHVFTGHVEAGLRSFNRSMPEELNRIATDHLSDLLLAPTELAVSHLSNEGLRERTILVGDVMADAVMSIDLDSVAAPSWAEGRFYVATLHRPSNTDHPRRLTAVLDAMASLDSTVHVLAHPRLLARLDEFGLKVPEGVEVHNALPYGLMLRAMTASAGILTDSGGLQKEAYLLRVPCTTLRSETEWPETLQGGWNVVAGDRLDDLAAIVNRDLEEAIGNPYGSGDAALRIVAELENQMS